MAGRSKPKKLDSEELWNYALRLLSGRPYSAAELKTKLTRRSDSATAVTGTMAQLRDYGMADDEKFSETFAASRLQNAGFGRSRVLRDLRAKRVPGPIAEKAVERTFERTEEGDLASQFLLRKYRNKDLRELLKDQKQFASAYRRLRVAGFSGAVSISLLKRYTGGASDWIDPEPDEEEA